MTSVQSNPGGSEATCRLAVDIGGTFTDVALETGGRTVTRKVLTTSRAPAEGVMQGIAEVLAAADVAASDVQLLIHGTTLATNTIIERKGAHTAMVVTEGFRDSVEMGYEHRFDQYDIYMEKPRPLVPRYLRLPVRERVSAKGEVLIELDEASVDALVPVLEHEGIESLAITLMHAYVNPEHEQRVAARLAERLPAVWITQSHQVCPEIREYERSSTSVANAYVQPLMASYLRDLEQRLVAAGFGCEMFLMMSGGGLTTVETAVAYPIRLVESGPAGGAVLATHIAAECGLDRVLSYDMGGTTAKICLIDDGQPQTSRTFEVDRQYRFIKGSGLPVRIPVIEMVEIGAGGGSIAHVDTLKRVRVGPRSAGSEPGPACYDRGGTDATVTDADVVLGRISADGFAGGVVQLAPERAAEALGNEVGAALDMAPPMAAFAVSEMVDDNMANAARVHAVELGKDISARTLVAFGGAAPLHACRLAEKLGIDRVIIPSGAGVGSALGFLRAPVAYEVVRSRYVLLDALPLDALNEMFAQMREEAEQIVRRGAPTEPLEESRIAYMRYRGQGYEIAVDIPNETLGQAHRERLVEAFNRTYEGFFGRTIPTMQVEILTWSLTVATARKPTTANSVVPSGKAARPIGERTLFDSEQVDYSTVPVYRRDALEPGDRLSGPAVIVEDQTTTVVTPRFDASIDSLGYIAIERRDAARNAT